MRKKYILFFMGLCLFSMSSCVIFPFFNLENWQGPQEREKYRMANRTVENIIKAMEMKDAEILKALFSKNVKQDPEIDEEIAMFIQDIHGDIITCDSEARQISSGIEKYYGKTRTEYTGDFNVETKARAYKITFTLYIKDDFDSDNVGLQNMHVIAEGIEFWIGDWDFAGH